MLYRLKLRIIAPNVAIGMTLKQYRGNLWVSFIFPIKGIILIAWQAYTCSYNRYPMFHFTKQIQSMFFLVVPLILSTLPVSFQISGQGGFHNERGCPLPGH